MTKKARNPNKETHVVMLSFEIWSFGFLSSTLRSVVRLLQPCPPSAVLLRRWGYGGGATEDGSFVIRPPSAVSSFRSVVRPPQYCYGGLATEDRLRRTGHSSFISFV